MQGKRGKRLVLCIVAPLLLVAACGLGRRGYDAVRRERLSRPLLHAIGRGDLGTVQTLLAQGADPNARDNGEEGARPSVWQVFRALFDRAWGRRAGAARGKGPSALVLAVRNNNAEIGIVRALLNSGADPNTRDEQGTPVLTIVMRSGDDVRLVIPLLDAGANVDSADIRDGKTPLMWAMGRSDTDLADRLLAKGANVNAHDRQGRTPLMLAARYGKARILRGLLQKGADVNTRNAFGLTALTEARLGGAAEIVPILEAAGAQE